MTDLFTPLTPANPAAPKPKCRRHQWTQTCNCRLFLAEVGRDCCCVGGRVCWESPLNVCLRCGAIRDDTRARRGKNNRSRGNAIEREIGKRLGLRRVGQYGGPDDLSGELFSAQVKSGGAFPERLWSWLKAVPVNAGQTPLLVVTDAPGPGRKRRAVVVLDIDDWLDLHGPTEAA